MPFAKGNQLWKKGLEARNEQKELVNDFLGVVVSGGIQEYGDKLSDLSEGKELTKEELDFMDRTEKLFPYVMSKKMPVNDDGDSVFEIKIKTV